MVKERSGGEEGQLFFSEKRKPGIRLRRSKENLADAAGFGN
jgi:hypothetical protein